jgi:acetyl esterase/lipase
MEDESVLSRPSAPPDATLAYGEAPEQLADVRFAVQAEGTRPRPLVVLVHGGFWRPAYDRAHTGPMAAALSLEGFTVASIEYRRVPGKPDLTLADVAKALDVLPGKVERHDGRVLLMGHSAGGHLVLWAAAAHDVPALAGVVALAPVADLRLAYRLNLGRGAVRAFLGDQPEHHSPADPIRLATPRAPVTIVQGLDDDTVPPEVARAYAAKHPTTRVVEVPGAAHFAVIDPLSAQTNGAWKKVVEELRRLADRPNP